MASANLLVLVGLSVPSHLAGVYFRALRWRHLTDPVQSIETGPLFRATAVGFMANNIFPFRIGEVVRAWYLARETRAPTAAIFGTIILERVVDAVMVVGMAVSVITIGGAGLGGGGISFQMLPLLLLAGLPLAFVVTLRVAPDMAIRFAMVFARPLLPTRIEERVEAQLRRLAEGLEALRGGSHLFWIAWHSVLIWGVFAVIPFYAAVLALDLDLGSALRAVSAAYVVLVFVGAAVALPSAPGFLGTYHMAAKFALAGFGVSGSQALALGTLAHIIFWVTLTLLGLAVLRYRGTSLETTLDAVAGSDPPSDPR